MENLIFEQTEHGAVLTGVNGAPVHAVVPEAYQGQRVCAVGNYAFAQQKQLKSVTLPDGVERIGDHAFYNCRSLEQLTLHHGVGTIGDGAFKNCEALCRITMQGMQHIRHILSDFMNEITLTMTFEDGQTAVLLFPEYDYEYLENVPPREFRSVTYGSGSFYRRCVSNADVDFAQYDKTFERAVREDAPETVRSIAFLRLLYPYRLPPAARQRYLDYLAAHSAEAAEAVLRDRDIPRLELLLTHELMDQDALSGAISQAAELDFPEAVSLLMDHRLARFGRRRRRFAL
ncbi:MAG: leucine-rich repeat domain-containing protein [Butyricicoccaceae bacterium]